jgi:hypothetical protein
MTLTALLPLMVIAWTICLTVFLALLLYRGQLTRHAVGSMFLNEAVDNPIEVEQNDLMRRVDRIDPFVKGAAALTAFFTVVMVGLYVVQILPTVHFG